MPCDDVSMNCVLDSLDLSGGGADHALRVVIGRCTGPNPLILPPPAAVAAAAAAAAAAGVGVFGSGSDGNVGWAAIALGAEAVRAVKKQVEKPRVRCVLEDRWPAWLVHLRTGQDRTEQEKEIK